MKKFGTPSGAAPGSANENVGLAGVGTPLEFFFLDFAPCFLGLDGLVFFLGLAAPLVPG
jgi:hypothetical protein